MASQGPTTAVPAGNKLAMSRALGAAFLNHQVEQLEKSVNGSGTGNWRDRRSPQTRGGYTNPNGRGGIVDRSARRPPEPSQDSGKSVKSKPREVLEREKEKTEVGLGRRSYEEARKGEKDADVVVVDSSVLVHALYQVKKWCKEGRGEIIIVPLEGMCLI